MYTCILLVVIIGACVCIYQRQNACFKEMQEQHASAAREQLIAEITRDTGLKKIAAEPDNLRDLILQRDMHEAAEQHTNAAMEQYRNELNNAQSWLEVFLGLLGIITVVFGLIGYWNARETRKDLQEAQEAMTMALQMKSEIEQAHKDVTAQQESAKKNSHRHGLASGQCGSRQATIRSSESQGRRNSKGQCTHYRTAKSTLLCQRTGGLLLRLG
jgi:uncharacterized protein YpmB